MYIFYKEDKKNINRFQFKVRTLGKDYNLYRQKVLYFCDTI